MTAAPGPSTTWRELRRRQRGEDFASELGVVVPGADVPDLERRLERLAWSRTGVGVTAFVVAAVGLVTRAPDGLGGLAIALPLAGLVVVLVVVADQVALERGPLDTGPGLSGGAELLGPLLRYGAPLLLVLLGLGAVVAQTGRAWWLPGGYAGFLVVAHLLGDHLARLPLPEAGEGSRAWRIAWRATVLVTTQGLAAALAVVGVVFLALPSVSGTIVSSVLAPVLGWVIGTSVGRPRRLVARRFRVS